MCKWVFVFRDGRRLPGPGEMHLLVSPGPDICRQGPEEAATTSSLSRHPITDHSSRRAPLTHHTLVTRNVQNYTNIRRECGDPTPLTAPRWHLFLLAANLRQNFFPTFFVVKTQPAGGAWVLLTHVSIFREGVCFSPSPQPIFYVSYLTSSNESCKL